MQRTILLNSINKLLKRKPQCLMSTLLALQDGTLDPILKQSKNTSTRFGALCVRVKHLPEDWLASFMQHVEPKIFDDKTVFSVREQPGGATDLLHLYELACGTDASAPTATHTHTRNCAATS